MKWMQNVMVGLLFFGALSIVAHFTVFSESGPFAKRGQQIVLFFENADGIKIGSKVTVLGVPTGTVVNVALVPVDRDNKRVEVNSSVLAGQIVAVVIEVKQDIIFFENYKVAIKSESLLSGKLVAIDPGSERDPENKKEFKILKIFKISALKLSEKNTTALQEELIARKRSLSSADTAAFVDLKGETSGDPIAGITQLIEDNRDNIRVTFDNIAQITYKINNGRGTIGRLINDDELHRNTETLLTDAQIVLKELRESLEDTREQAPVTSFIRAALTAF